MKSVLKTALYKITFLMLSSHTLLFYHRELTSSVTLLVYQTTDSSADHGAMRCMIHVMLDPLISSLAIM